ncbi:hypothetical protein [Thermomonospora umbrina]|uniref:hypothetical protein n=1 Tax=Thermomonospora umbrina TaxID=111806 RepID=UPI000E27BF4C|nr:hypothetical protein [Thermomonospora umbrina]
MLLALRAAGVAAATLLFWTVTSTMGLLAVVLIFALGALGTWVIGLLTAYGAKMTGTWASRRVVRRGVGNAPRRRHP